MEAVFILVLLVGIWVLINGFNGNLAGVVTGQNKFNI
jgi:hypothetical protein